MFLWVPFVTGTTLLIAGVRVLAVAASGDRYDILHASRVLARACVSLLCSTCRCQAQKALVILAAAQNTSAVCRSARSATASVACRRHLSNRAMRKYY